MGAHANLCCKCVLHCHRIPPCIFVLVLHVQTSQITIRCQNVGSGVGGGGCVGIAPQIANCNTLSLAFSFTYLLHLNLANLFLRHVCNRIQIRMKLSTPTSPPALFRCNFGAQPLQKWRLCIPGSTPAQRRHSQTRWRRK